MKRAAFLSVAMLLLGCKTTSVAQVDSPPISHEEKALIELDARLEQHYEETALPVGASSQELKETLVPKAESITTLQKEYLAFAGGKNLEAHAHATLRVGQLYLNFACELVTMEPAGGRASPRVAEQLQAELSTQASPFLGKSKQALESAAERGEGRYAEEAASLAERVNPANGIETCASSESYWLVENRPRGKSPAELAAQDCASTFGVDARCREVYVSECNDGDGHACHDLGMVAWDRGEVEAAAEHFRRGCDLEHSSACRAAAVVLLPRSKNYESACTSGEAVACMQLAQVHGGLEGLGEVCTATSGLAPASKGTLNECTSGDAAACWRRAGTLARERPYELPRLRRGGGGMLGTLGSPDGEARAEWRRRLEEECGQDRAYACLQLGRIRAEDGEDPLANYRRACELDAETGCRETASILLERETDEVEEAVAILKKSCGSGHDMSCDDLAVLFVEGKRVARSDPCAVAYLWQRCSPENLYACDAANRLFHPKK